MGWMGGRRNGSVGRGKGEQTLLSSNNLMLIEEEVIYYV